MAAAAAAKEAAASLQPRVPMPAMRSDDRGLLLGLPPDARAEDIEYVLSDVQRTLSRLESKRETLQYQIAAVSRGKQRAPRRAPAPPPAAPAVVGAVPVPAADDDPGARYTAYTREGAGAVRRGLRAAARDAKKERKRLEAVWGDLEEALVDARERLALQPDGERTA